MVSKVAVIALVAVVAVPILLGYGLNINTEDRQVWKENNDPLNARDFLTSAYDATGATFTDADTYMLNSNIFEPKLTPTGIKLYPQYVGHTSTKTSIALSTDYNVPALPSLGFASSNGPSQVVVDGGFDSVNYWQVALYDTNNAHLNTYPRIKYFSLGIDGVALIERYNSSGNIVSNTVNGVGLADFSAVGSPTCKIWYEIPGRGDYIDITKGYRLNMDGAVWNPANLTRPSNVYGTLANVSQTMESILMTLDLSTITDSDVMFEFYDGQGYLFFKKTTTNGVVKWEYTADYHELSMEPYNFKELYYDPSLTSNTYQLYLNADSTGELRYVGIWPDRFGPATELIKYSFELWHNPNITPREYLNALSIYGQTPVMRIDAARVGAYDYRVMENAIYNPALFRSNPITTISNSFRFGTSLEFGGITYTVSKGNITLGTHEVSLEGMTFESIQIAGQYENRINGNTVSITPAPSSITFNGKWSADVITESQSTSTVSETKWEPGKFAWQGVDTDFKIAGILASLGAFIAIGIYARRSNAKVWPLLLVCGGAAFTFLVMI